MATKAKPYPFPGLSRGQRRAIEAIATGDSTAPGCHNTSLLQLELKGLIHKVGWKVLGQDALGQIRVPEYDVKSFKIHIAITEWLASEYDRMVAAGEINPED